MSISLDNLWKNSATEVISLLKNKTVSPEEVLTVNLNRIEETHNNINAISTK